MTSCSVTSWSVLRFQATETAPPMTRAHFYVLFKLIHERVICLFIVCEIMFTIGESRAISHTNDTEQQAQQEAAIPCRRKFSTETPLENAD